MTELATFHLHKISRPGSFEVVVARDGRYYDIVITPTGESYSTSIIVPDFNNFRKIRVPQREANTLIGQMEYLQSPDNADVPAEMAEAAMFETACKIFDPYLRDV